MRKIELGKSHISIRHICNRYKGLAYLDELKIKKNLNQIVYIGMNKNKSHKQLSKLIGVSTSLKLKLNDL